MTDDLIYEINKYWVGTYKLDENKNAIPCKTLECVLEGCKENEY